METHGIAFVDDQALQGHDFALISLADGDEWVFYREKAVTPSVLEDSWAAYRALGATSVGVPQSAPDPQQQLGLAI